MHSVPAFETQETEAALGGCQRVDMIREDLDARQGHDARLS